MRKLLTLLFLVVVCTSVRAQYVNTLPTIDDPQDADRILSYTRGFPAAFRLDTLKAYFASGAAGIDQVILKYTDGTSYNSGEIVKRDGVLYLALNDGVSNPTDDFSSDWYVISSNDFKDTQTDNVVTLRGNGESISPKSKYNVLLIGDSNTNAADRFYGPLRDYLNIRFSVGGVGYISFAEAQNAPTGINVERIGTVSSTTGENIGDQLGPDMSYVTLGANDTVRTRNPLNDKVNDETEYHFTDLEVFYDDSETGSFNLIIDGVVNQLITTGSGDALESVNVSGLDREWHDIDLARVSGSPKIYGIVNSSSDRITLSKLGANGMSYKTYVNGQDFDHWLSFISALAPDEIILNLGSNDLNGYDQSATLTAASTMLDSLAAQMPNATLSIVVPSERLDPTLGRTETYLKNSEALQNLLLREAHNRGLSSVNLFEQWSNREPTAPSTFFLDDVHYTGVAGETNGRILSKLLQEKSGEFSDIFVNGRIVTANDENTVNIGANSGVNSKGEFNVNIGVFAGSDNLTDNSVNIGFKAGETGAGSISIGSQAGRVSAAGGISIGPLAGEQTTGGSIVSIGENAGRFSASNQSVYIGNNAGASSTGIFGNVGIGTGSLQSSDNRDNTAVGHESGKSSGLRRSVMVGYGAGQFSDGDYTTFLGRYSGRYGTANRSTFLGANLLSASGDETTTYENATAIGANIAASRIASNKVILGNNLVNEFQAGDVLFDVEIAASQYQEYRASATGEMTLIDANDAQGREITNSIPATASTSLVTLGQLTDSLSNFSGGGGGSYDDTELRDSITEIRTDLNALPADIDAAQAAAQAYADANDSDAQDLTENDGVYGIANSSSTLIPFQTTSSSGQSSFNWDGWLYPGMYEKFIRPGGTNEPQNAHHLGVNFKSGAGHISQIALPMVDGQEALPTFRIYNPSTSTWNSWSNFSMWQKVDKTASLVSSAITGRENILRVTTSDDTNAEFGLGNGTASTGQFRPAFYGYSARSSYPLLFRGLTNSANADSGDALILFQAAATSSGTDPNNGTLTAVGRKLFEILNAGASAFVVSADGDVTANGYIGDYVRNSEASTVEVKINDTGIDIADGGSTTNLTRLDRDELTFFGTQTHGLQSTATGMRQRIGNSTYVDMPNALPTNDLSVWAVDATGSDGKYIHTANLYEALLDGDETISSTTLAEVSDLTLTSVPAGFYDVEIFLQFAMINGDGSTDGIQWDVITTNTNVQRSGFISTFQPVDGMRYWSAGGQALASASGNNESNITMFYVDRGVVRFNSAGDFDLRIAALDATNVTLAEGSYIRLTKKGDL